MADRSLLSFHQYLRSCNESDSTRLLLLLLLILLLLLLLLLYYSYYYYHYQYYYVNHVLSYKKSFTLPAWSLKQANLVETGNEN